MINAIVSQQTPVWGRWWQGIIPENLIHGSVSLWKVIQIYSRARAAFGLRYPKQREQGLISSRYWLAPLNGCSVVSDEVEVPGVQIPGVTFAPYDFVEHISAAMSERRSAAQSAAEFWAAQSAVINEGIANRLQHLVPRYKRTLNIMRLEARYRASIRARKVKSCLP